MVTTLVTPVSVFVANLKSSLIPLYSFQTWQYRNHTIYRAFGHYEGIRAEKKYLTEQGIEPRTLSATRL